LFFGGTVVEMIAGNADEGVGATRCVGEENHGSFEFCLAGGAVKGFAVSHHYGSSAKYYRFGV